MRLREVLVYPEILSSKRVTRLKPFAQLFYRNLMHVCDGAGVFENDPLLICQALYPRALDRVKPEAVATWLMECQEAGLIRFYTDDRGRALGEFETWLQKDTNRKKRYQGKREQPPEELAGLYDAGAPPPAPPHKLNRRKVSVNGRAAAGPHSTDDDTWLTGLAATWPEIDVRAEFRKASKRYPLGFGRHFFEAEWLPKAERPVKLNGATVASVTIEPEPAGWWEYLKNRHRNESWAESAAFMPWASLPPQWRETIIKGMKA